MKTKGKNKFQVNEKVKRERRNLNNAVKFRKNLSDRKRPALDLKQQDYQDIIDIKRARSEKTANNSRMFFAMGLAIVLLATNIIFNWKFVDAAMVSDLELLHNADFEEILEVPPTEQPPPPPPQILKQPVIVEVPDEEILEDVEVDLDVEVTEEMVVEQVEFEEVMIEEEVAEEIFQIVEHSPEPYGGIKAFYQFVNENIEYPSPARRMNITGRVFVKFVVNKEGKVTDVHAVKGIGGGCDEEAERIIAMSPDWKPGRQRGKPVNVYMMLPITFILK